MQDWVVVSGFKCKYDTLNKIERAIRGKDDKELDKFIGRLLTEREKNNGLLTFPNQHYLEIAGDEEAKRQGFR